MKRLIQVLSIAIMAAFMAVSLTNKVEAKPEYTKKESKPCTTCHVKASSKELNDTGKCYEKNNHSLKDCKLPTADDKKDDKKGGK